MIDHNICNYTGKYQESECFPHDSQCVPFCEKFEYKEHIYISSLHLHSQLVQCNWITFALTLLQVGDDLKMRRTSQRFISIAVGIPSCQHQITQLTFVLKFIREVDSFDIISNKFCFLTSLPTNQTNETSLILILQIEKDLQENQLKYEHKSRHTLPKTFHIPFK